LNLVLVARRQAELQAVADELAGTHGIECRALSLDLTAEAAAETLDVATRELEIGLVVLSAGFGTSGLFVDSPWEPELEMLHVNCRALAALTWRFGRRLSDRGRGGIVLLSSIVGFQGMPYAAHYAATKAYVQVLGEGLAIELAARGVDVLAAAPGPTSSGFAERARMKMGAALDPTKIARPILDSLGHRSTVLPGFLSKLLVYSIAPLPRWSRIRIMGRVMRGMTTSPKGVRG
jgi:short-subunit dehydrogenase